MASKMDPRALLLASGGALPRQETARRLKKQEKRSKERPKSNPRGTKEHFETILAPLARVIPEGPAGCARLVKAIPAD